MDEENRHDDEACTATYFAEKDECLRIIQSISKVDNIVDFSLFETLKRILDKYQEQSQLLDPYMEQMVSPLMKSLKDLSRKIQEAEIAAICAVGRAMNAIINVRGYKTVSNFMSHEPADLEPALDLLSRLESASDTVPLQSGPDPLTTWEAKRVALLWLGVLVLVPFDLSTVDSTLADLSHPDAKYPPLMRRLVDTAKRYLSDPSSAREMAAVLLGRLLPRPDAAAAREDFLEWAEGELVGGSGGDEDAEGGMRAARLLFLVPGVAHSLSALFKSGQRGTLLPLVPRIWPLVLQVSDLSSQSSNILARKLSVKLAQRVGLTLLVTQERTWGMGSAVSSLDSNLSRERAAGDPEGGEGGEERSGGPEDGEGEYVVAEEVEDVIQLLLQGLRDKDTVVRWSSAKGLGRVAARLPQELGDELVGAALELMTDAEADAAWHGACIALAEMARRGLLLPHRLDEACPLVSRALHYDVRRGPHSVGIHVRDAAAYVCWALARAYPPHLLRAVVERLAPDMLTVACYDREVMCRRAAAAAFQECVGRLGSFQNGIDILTAADFFTLASRHNAYLSVAPFVASFAPFRRPLASHLFSSKVAHWDASVREVAAKGLAALVGSDTAFFAVDVVDDLVPRALDSVLEVRHGAALALAAVVRALAAAGVGLEAERATRVVGVAPGVDKARLFRGKGGEIMRGAVCRVIGAVADARLDVPIASRRKMMDMLDENLRHPNPEIQREAAEALGLFTGAFMADATANQVARTALTYTPLLSDANAAARRGAALALAALPAVLIRPALGEVTAALAAALMREESSEERDAEARANAARAIGVVGRAALAGRAAEEVTAWVCEEASAALLVGCEDYSTDKRGDVGSWVREAAMRSLVGLLEMVADAGGGAEAGWAATGEREGESGGVGDLAARVVGVLLRQAIERIGRIREAAGMMLGRVVEAMRRSEALKGGERGERALRAAERAAGGAEWSAGLGSGDAGALERVVREVGEEGFGDAVMDGIAASMGGLDHALAKSVGDALGSVVGRGGGAMRGAVARRLVASWSRHARCPRMAPALLKATDALFTRVGLGEEEESVLAGVLEAVRNECRGCRDVGRLMAAATCLAHLTAAPGETRKGAIVALLTMMGSRFPKVRRFAAEQLYVRALALDVSDLASAGLPASEEGLDQLQETLVSYAWDGPLDAIREPRDGLFVLLGLLPPKRVAKAPHAESTAQAEDENAHYRALVEDAARGL